MKRISIILACYNEQESLPLFFNAVDPVIKDIKDYQFDFVLVNDGSKDHTLQVMSDLYQTRNDITVVSLSKNFGQNPAISAGLNTATGDYVIMMDADLQDPVAIIKDIAEKFTEGYEVVNPQRNSRKKDSFFKRSTAGLFYKFINHLERKEIIPQEVNCFRGLSRKAVNEINSLSEKDRYLVIEVPLIGYKTCYIEFSRDKRQVGHSKYNFDKMFMYAFNNISAGTARPLYKAITIGACSTLFFLLSSLALLIVYILELTNVINFYSSIPVFLLISCMFLAVSIVIFFIGINGLYEHNILINTRNRPTYIIEEIKKPENK